jgi:hypothetical protein
MAQKTLDKHLDVPNAEHTPSLVWVEAVQACFAISNSSFSRRIAVDLDSLEALR